MQITEALPPTAIKKREAEIIILEEGPGSKSRSCWYGPEAITSGQGIFRGAQVYCNHPSKTQLNDLPERDIREIVGRIKETYVATGPNGKKQLRGVLKVLEGDQYDWVLSLIHESLQSRKEGFPPVASVSIHADGDTEKRCIEGSEYNYVKNIKSAVSVDIVTRGGIKNAGFTKFLESYGGSKMTKEERMAMIDKKIAEALNSEDRAFLESADAEDANLQEDGGDDDYEQVYAMEDGTFITESGEQVDPEEIFAADQAGNVYTPEEIAAAAEQTDAVQEPEQDEQYEEEGYEADEVAEPIHNSRMHARGNSNEVPISELATRFPMVANAIDTEEMGVEESDRDVDIVNLKFENKLLKNRAVAEKKILESGLPDGWLEIDEMLDRTPQDMDRLIIQRQKQLNSVVGLVESARPVTPPASKLRESGNAAGVGRKILSGSLMPSY